MYIGIGIGIGIWILSCIVSMFLGKYPVSFYEWYTNHLTEEQTMVLYEIRLPRIILSSLCGYGLGIVGCVLQGIMRNTIVSPNIMGMTSGSAFGGLVGLYVLENYIGSLLLSFCMGILSIGIVFRIYEWTGKKEKSMILLSGIVVSTCFSSGIGFIKYIADPMEKLPSMIYWLMGTFGYIRVKEVYWIVFPMIVCIVWIHKMKYQLNVLSVLSDKEMKVRKIPYEKYTILLLLLSGIIISGVVSIGGMISWIGLMIPNFVRIVIGEDHRELVGYSGILGAIYLLMMDNFSRTIGQTEIPISIFTSLIGGPLFLYIVMKQKRRRKSV